MQAKWLHTFCDALGLRADQILSAARNPNAGMNNDTYVIQTVCGNYLYRIPGRHTEKYCFRAREMHAYAQLAPYRITDELVYFDPISGTKISKFYPNSHTCNPHSDEDVSSAMNALRKLHALPVSLDGVENPYARLQLHARLASEAGSGLCKRRDFREALEKLDALSASFDCTGAALRPIHADCLPGNILFRENGEVLLIDLEFAAMGCIYTDLADFCHDAGLSKDQCLSLLSKYLERSPRADECHQLFLYCAAVALMWSGWAAFKACIETAHAAFFDNYMLQSIRYAQDSLARLQSGSC